MSDPDFISLLFLLLFIINFFCRDGITSAETARETFHSKGRNAMSRNESSTVLQVSTHV